MLFLSPSFFICMPEYNYEQTCISCQFYKLIMSKGLRPIMLTMVHFFGTALEPKIKELFNGCLAGVPSFKPGKLHIL